MMKEDKPKELITAIKLLLTNGQILDPKFALAPLKHDEATTKPKLITAIDYVPVKFTHLGQYASPLGMEFSKKRRTGKERTTATPSPKRQITGTMCRNQRLSRTRWCTSW